jgi:F-type H+-transporting ATPase subunit b
MKAQIVKIVLPVVLALAFFAAPAVFATGHTGSGDDALVKSVEAAYEEHEAKVDAEHGDMAAAQHEEAMASEHHAEAAHVEGAATGAHGEGHKAPMITSEKLKDLFWRTANFLALVLILVKFLAKPIAGGLSGRRSRIQEEMEELQEKRDKAERSYKEFEGRLAGMEEEMEVVVEKAIALAGVEKERILKEAEDSAEEIKRQAEAAVKAAVADAKNKLQDEVAEQAAAMAEELIVKNLTAKDQVAITEQYLERVGAVQ